MEHVYLQLWHGCRLLSAVVETTFHSHLFFQPRAEVTVGPNGVLQEAPKQIEWGFCMFQF